MKNVYLENHLVLEVLALMKAPVIWDSFDPPHFCFTEILRQTHRALNRSDLFVNLPLMKGNQTW